MTYFVLCEWCGEQLPAAELQWHVALHKAGLRRRIDSAVAAELAALSWQRERLLHLLAERRLRLVIAAVPPGQERHAAELLAIADAMRQLRQRLEAWEP